MNVDREEAKKRRKLESEKTERKRSERSAI